MLLTIPVVKREIVTWSYRLNWVPTEIRKNSLRSQATTSIGILTFNRVHYSILIASLASQFWISVGGGAIGLTLNWGRIYG
jgi:hypothetical protein